MRKESLSETSFMYQTRRYGSYFEDDEPCCSLFVMPGNKNEEDYLKNIFSRITTPSPVWKRSIEMDTTYRMVDVHNNNTTTTTTTITTNNNTTTNNNNNNNNNNITTKHAHIMPRYESIAGSAGSNRASIMSRKIKTQSLSVNFILREELIGNEVHNIRKLFHSKPWSFHHTFQTFDMERQKVVSKQPYYELSEEYPLMSPSVCHKGSSVLRYNIFVKDFETMKRFYAELLRLQPMYEEANFCYFTIYSKNGAEIQLSLKHSKQLNIVPTQRSFLKIQLDNVYESVHEVGAKISEIFCSDCGVLVTHDPEGNPILVTGKSRAVSSSQSSATLSQRSTLSRKTRQHMDQWSDCSTGCSECFRNVHRRGYFAEQQDDSTCYNDSGYHNDVSSDDCDSSYDLRSYPRRYRMTNYSSNPHSRTDSYYGNDRHNGSSCTDKVLYDSSGRQYTCCVAYV